MAESAAERALRLMDLVPYLLNHPGATLKEVSAEFNITVSELIKDLDLLFMCGLPGYTPLELIDLNVEDGVISLREPQNLDAPRRFSQNEALIIRVALSALEELLPATNQKRVKALREKISRIFTNEIPIDAVFFHSDKERLDMQIIQEAFDSQKKLSMTYLNPVKSTLTQRKISVLRIVAENNRTLIEAWCDKSQGIRTFNLANIQSIEMTDEDISRPENSIKQVADVATVAVDPSTKFFLDNSAQLKRVGEDYEIEIFQEEWLVRSALAEGGTLVIRTPKSLKSRLSALAGEALQNYSGKELPIS